MKLNDLTRDLVMIGIVIAVIGFAGYELLHNPDSDAAKLLLGPVVGAFTLISNKLFGNNA